MAGARVSQPYCRSGPRGPRQRSDVSLFLYALAEIGGCFALCGWWRGASPLWLPPEAPALGLFAFLLPLTPPSHAGRSYAAYGGVYIAASLLWLWLVEGNRPTPSDIGGAALILAGAAVILFARRA